MFRYWMPLACLLAVSFAHESMAQRQSRRIPNFNRRPTVSPFINLFNSNQGGVNNYFSFVRPLQQQARINDQQIAQNRFLERQFTQPIVNTTSGGQQSGLLRQGSQGVGQASTAATYFNYSHFYNVPNANGAGGSRR